MSNEARNFESYDESPESERDEARLRPIPRSGPERKRRMSEIIARIAERDREILAKLAQ